MKLWSCVWEDIPVLYGKQELEGGGAAMHPPAFHICLSANASNYLTSISRPLAEAARWVCAVLAAAVWRVNPMASSVYLAGSEMCKYIICKAGKERLGRICGSVGRTKKNVF